tara:strand:- start:483 stop:782 length:300 start_codon:yes stop_codon:yes gene_type:complete
LQRNKILEVAYAVCAYPFFNGVEANKINPALDDLEFDTVLDEFKADRMCTQIVRDFQAAGYTHVDDSELDNLIPIQQYIDQVEAVTQSNIEFHKRRQNT